MSDVVIGAIGTVAGAVIAGLVAGLAYFRTPKGDVGALVNQTVTAAEKAGDMLEESYQAKVDDLEERVQKLEELVVAKDTKIIALEAHIDKQDETIKKHIRWVKVLAAQVVEGGGVPIMWEEIANLDNFGKQED